MARLTSWLERYLMVSWAVIAVCAAVAIYWTLDRTPPFELRGYTIPPTPLGETAHVTASVRRDMTRGCSVSVTRYFVDSQKVKHAVGATTYMTPGALGQMQRDTPDQYRGAFKVPDDAALGEGTLVTALEYRCNPVHAMWPIDYLMEMQMEVLP